jgi:methylmalonyl-CoA mutase, N-terminal domain
MGGMVAAIERSYPQREIHESAYRYQQQLERNDKLIIGVNEYVLEKEAPIPILKINVTVEKKQIEKLSMLRQGRDSHRVELALGRLNQAARGNENLMPYARECVAAYATLGEICNVLRGVFGLYQEPSF